MSKVLVAHGNTRKLRAAVEILREAGFEVIATPDGGDAFARFFEETPGVVLCSAHLPGLSGVSFAAMVRSQVPSTHVAILVDPDAPAELDEAPGVSTILEPLTLESLHALFPALEGRAPSNAPDDQVPTTSGVFALAALKRFQRDNSLLAVVDDQGLSAIAAIAENEVLAGDARVISEGEPGDGFYLVVEGQVRVTLAEKGNQEIARIGAGGFFGEMAMLSARPRSASVWTVGPTTLLYFPKDAFMPLLERYPTMREVLSGVALKRTEENLWRSLFDDQDVQRSLGSLSAAPDEAAAPPQTSGEASWNQVAASGGAPKASTSGGGTWNPLPSLPVPGEEPTEASAKAESQREAAPRLPVEEYDDTDEARGEHDDDEVVAHAVNAARRRGFAMGMVLGLLVGGFIVALAVREGVVSVETSAITEPAGDGDEMRVEPKVERMGPPAPTVLPPVPLGPEPKEATKGPETVVGTAAVVPGGAIEPKAAIAPTGPTEAKVAAAPTAPTEPKATTAPTGPTEPKAATAPTAPTEPKAATEPKVATASTVPTEAKVAAAPTAPTEPKATTAPTGPTEPKVATAPTAPTEPKATTAPTGPTEPKATTAPTAPTQPKATTAPTAPTEPKATTAPTGATEPKAATEPKVATASTVPTEAKVATEPKAPPATTAPSDPAASPAAPAVPTELANSTIADADRKKLRRELMAGIQPGGDAVKAVKAGLTLEAGNALDWESVFALARAQQLGGEADKALVRYNAFITTYPKNDFVDDAYFYSGEIYEARGRKADAITAFKNVLTRTKSDHLEAAQRHLDGLQ